MDSSSTVSLTPSIFAPSDVLTYFVQGHNMQLQKESGYVQCLQAGKDSADGKNKTRKLRAGIQKDTEVKKVSEEEEFEILNDFFVEIDEMAMTAVMAETERLQPMLVEVHKHPDWLCWQAAIETKLKSLKDTQIWTIISCPFSVNVIGDKWVLCIKLNANSEIDSVYLNAVLDNVDKVVYIEIPSKFLLTDPKHYV